MLEPVDPHHLLLIGAGPGVGASVVRRFGREGFRSTLISRSQTLDRLAPELRRGGLEIEAIGADIEDLDGYRETLEGIFSVPGAPGVVVYNAALPDPGPILDTTVEPLRTAHDVDVLGAVVTAQVAAPVLRAAGGGTLLVTSGGFADNPVPALASLSMGKAALRSAQTLVAAGVREDGIHAATVTIAGNVKPGTDFDPDTIAEAFLDRPHRLEGRVADRVSVHRRVAAAAPGRGRLPRRSRDAQSLHGRRCGLVSASARLISMR